MSINTVILAQIFKLFPYLHDTILFIIILTFLKENMLSKDPNIKMVDKIVVPFTVPQILVSLYFGFVLTGNVVNKSSF